MPIFTASAEVGSALMACPNNLQTESEFLKALQAADNYYINGDELILNKARIVPLTKFKTFTSDK
ncbi:META domain-containing protein [Parafilimonas sp.]|uniref:META domain-containing protein n=1 Tax=Parafilimonas sp. TaxID=1969739 RepID=UPI003F7E0BB6